MTVRIYPAARPKRMPKYVQVGKTVYMRAQACRVLGIRGPLVDCEIDGEKRVFHYTHLRRREDRS